MTLERSGMNVSSASSRPIRSNKCLYRGLAFALTVFALVVFPQSGAAQSKANTAKRYRVPGSLHENLQVLGDRFTVPGKERLALFGTLTDVQGASNVQLVYELPGRFRLERSGKTLIFDGKTASTSAGTLSADDEKLLETLSADSPDGFFSAVNEGAALHLIGRRFRVPGKGRGSPSTLCDIFELIRPIRERKDGAVRIKHYYFDSATGLLGRSRYRMDAGSGNLVDVTFGNWQNVGGQLIPTQITRTENGTSVLSLQVTGANITPRADDALFR